MASPPSLHHPRHFRSGRRASSSPAAAPDLAAAAREAVVGFLHDSSMGGLADETSQPTGGISAAKAGPSTVAVKIATDDAAGGFSAAMRTETPAERAVAPGESNAESVAVRAAAMGVATLDRIEAAAAKVEADIRSALLAQAELQAGAGAAAEAAVRAAEKSWIAAHTAVAAEGRAKVILGVMTRYLAVTIVLVVITIIFLAITASVAH
jgi:hypothetical protein